MQVFISHSVAVWIQWDSPYTCYQNRINLYNNSVKEKCSIIYYNMLQRLPETIDFIMHTRLRDNVKCFQFNLQHSRTAASNLGRLINQHTADITYVQEPHTMNNKLAGLPRIHKVYTSKDGKKRTAIVIKWPIGCHTKYPIVQWGLCRCRSAFRGSKILQS
jgi:hypothetical protein